MSEEIKIGGEERPRIVVPIQTEDGTPKYYHVMIRSYRKKPGRPNDAGEETFYYSWKFEVIEPGGQDGVILYGSTNAEARRSFTTKKPLKLLQLLIAVNGGKEPEKGKTVRLDDIVGRQLKVQLENVTNDGGETFQQVANYYAVPPAALVEVPQERMPKIKSSDVPSASTF